MGQRIEVLDADVLGEVAIFDTDRSLSGMDGETYTTIDEARAANTYPAGLAERLMLADGSIRSVYTYSNAISVSRSGGWTDETVARSSDLITNFFVVYEENRT